MYSIPLQTKGALSEETLKHFQGIGTKEGVPE